jgi:hypothetical protein
MKLSWATSALLLIGGLAGASTARAQEAEPRPMLLTIDLGYCGVPGNHPITGGNPVLLGYLGGTLQLDLHGPLAANIFVGLGGCLTVVAGGTARFAGQWHDDVRVTAGVGPMYAAGGSLLAEGDVALEIRSRAGFAFVVGPKLGVTLNRTGGGNLSSCVDSCDPVVSAGTYFVLIRLGLGFNI